MKVIHLIELEVLRRKLLEEIYLYHITTHVITLLTNLNSITFFIFLSNLNVISVEDPVEQILNGITQISVNEKAGINYESSFKAILRCDPDVILIGEIRDSTVAKYVIQASLSGHLVLSTMHANDCKGALLRLLEMGISVQELCQAINLISNQRLITTTTNTRQLVSELMFQSQINYFFEHNHSLPKNFTKLSTHLNKMSKEGVICEEVVDKYI